MPSPSPLLAHGGRLDAAAARFPRAPLPWIDLSTGIGPLAYPLAALDAVDHRALPSPAALAALETAAAAAFGMASGAVCALPGSEIGLRLLATIGLPAPVRVVRPCYGSYDQAFPGAGTVAAGELDGASRAAGTILLGNPNNPDGRVVAPARLIDGARASAAAGGWLVVDEAFADAVDGASVLPLLGADDPVLVLRSFGKFHGLAGIRLGFACGHRALVERLRHRLGDWPVSAAAIALGTAAYRDAGWRDRTRAELARRAGELDALLARHGLSPTGACPLFRLVDTPDAAGLFDRLGRAGLLTRPFAQAPRRLRFGLPADARATARLDRALGDAAPGDR